MNENIDYDLEEAKMIEDTYTFVSKFRIDNLAFTVFAGTTGCYRVIDKDIENGIKNGVERESFYADFEHLFDVFSDELTEDQLRGLEPVE